MADPTTTRWTTPRQARKWFVLSLLCAVGVTAGGVWLAVAEPGSLSNWTLLLLGIGGILCGTSCLVSKPRLAKWLMGASFLPLGSAFVLLFVEIANRR